MAADSGILEFKTEAEVKDYMDDLGLRFEFGCIKEKNPTSCHSLAQWYETYKRSPKECAAVLKENCFDRKYGDSCFKYGFYKLLGKAEVTRDPLLAYQAFEFGCQSASHGKCCQAAGRLVAEGIASHTPTLSAATPLFERGCKLGMEESCFHLGGALITLVQRLEENETANQSSESTAKEIKEMRCKALNAWVEGCKLGHELSCRNVSRMYRKGDGVSIDQTKANHFKKLAEEIAAKRTEIPPLKAKSGLM